MVEGVNHLEIYQEFVMDHRPDDFMFFNIFMYTLIVKFVLYNNIFIVKFSINEISTLAG